MGKSEEIRADKRKETAQIAGMACFLVLVSPFVAIVSFIAGVNGITFWYYATVLIYTCIAGIISALLALGIVRRSRLLMCLSAGLLSALVALSVCLFAGVFG